MMIASPLAAGNSYGEAPTKRRKGKSGEKRAIVRLALTLHWWACAGLGRHLDLDPELIRYHIQRIAETEIVFVRHVPGGPHRKRIAIYRIFPPAVNVTAVAVIPKTKF
jgi:hypothetical protein